MKKRIHYLVAALIFCNGLVCLAQKKKELPKHEKEALQHIFKGNQKLLDGNVLDGEKSYRRAISKDPNSEKAKYNLGYSYYKTKNFQEAVQRNKQAAELAKTKSEKHVAYHNLGNSYLQMQKPDEAIEAYKDALRNNPMDDETRYNLAVARLAKEQQDKQDNKDQDKDNKDKKNNEDKKDGKDKDDKKDKDGDKDDKDNKDKKDDKKEDEGDKDKNEKENDKGEDKEDKDPKDPKDKDGDKGDEKDDKEKEGQPKPTKGKLSPEQVKSLLEAMENQEKKVQDKINAQKVRGPKVKSDKDW